MGAPLFLPRRPATVQPQSGTAIDRSNPSVRRTAFAYLPSVGFFNCVNGLVANQSTTPTIGASQVGATFDGGGRAEFPVSIDASNGLTIISVWRARSAQYLASDSTTVLVGTRNSGNAGWSWGRYAAVAGSTNGNKTAQRLTFQGVASYTETNSTIESFVDTPVACRYDPVAGKISWFRFGQRSSPDTAASAPTLGGTLVLGAQGPFSSSVAPWLDRAAGVLIIPGVLSDAEIYALTSSPQAVWQAFEGPRRVLPIAASAPGWSATATDATTSSASLNTSIALAASGAAGTTGSASLATQVALTSSAAVTTTGSASLSTAVSLSATSTDPVTSSASLSTQILLSASGSTRVTPTATLATGISLAGSSVTTTAASAALNTGSLWIASSSVPCSSSASLSTGLALAAVAKAADSSSASLATAVTLAAAVIDSVRSSASLTTTSQAQQGVGLSASSLTPTCSNAALQTSIALSASGTSATASSARLYERLAAILYQVPAENRLYLVPAENRILTV